jgi:hypothetical protein
MNNRNIYACLGASNHVKEERQCEDYYATSPHAVDLLLAEEDFSLKVWECACGEGHLSERMKFLGKDVYSSDLIDRGYGDSNIDFLNCIEETTRDIITNPPYKLALEFVQKSLELLRCGGKVAMFLKLTFLEGKKRKQFFISNPPKVLYVSSSRIICAKNGEFDKVTSSAVAYGWYVWEKGFKGETKIKWIN